LPLAGCATSTQSDTVSKAELAEPKQAFWPSIYAEKNAPALKDFLSDDFVLIAVDQVRTKGDEVSWLKDPGDWEQPSDFAYRVLDMIMIAPDAAIIYGQGTSTRTNDADLTCKHSYLSSNTLRRVRGEWYPVTSHVSGATCEVSE